MKKYVKAENLILLNNQLEHITDHEHKIYKKENSKFRETQLGNQCSIVNCNEIFQECQQTF